MATHADIWLPLAPEQVGSPMLYCEAWSDGHMDVVGYGALCSSSAISETCKLSALLAGSPVFHLPQTNVFEAKEGDYVVDSFTDDAGEDDDPEAIRQMVEEALAAIERGDAAGALSGPLSLIGLQDKLDKGWGLNARVLDEPSAWRSFLETCRIQTELGSDDAAKALALAASQGAADGRGQLSTAQSYYWRDGRFWGAFSLDDAAWSTAPLIQLAALTKDLGPRSDIPAYLARITEQDRASLLSLLAELTLLGVPHAGLFDGRCDAQVNSILESSALEASVGDGQDATRRPSL